MNSTTTDLSHEHMHDVKTKAPLPPRVFFQCLLVSRESFLRKNGSSSFCSRVAH